MAAHSSSASPGGWEWLSTVLFSLGGAGVVLVGFLPLLFMLLATANAARSDPLVWLATILVISLVTLGVLLIVYAIAPWWGLCVQVCNCNAVQPPILGSQHDSYLTGRLQNCRVDRNFCSLHA